MPTRYFALALGVIYLLVGILGFIPGLVHPPPAGTPQLAVANGYGYLFGLFPVNLVHNLFHLLIGLLGIGAYFRYGMRATTAVGWPSSMPC
jgi:hypothetical protein